MRACIHRGAAEIGGSCVELESEGRRLVLDLGLPLNSQAADKVPLPKITGLTHSDDSLLGVVVSHGHPDHYGLLEYVGLHVPVLIGEAAERILKEAHFFGAAPPIPEAARYLCDRVPIQVGPFRITPYLIDHSAFDSYALEIEAGGRRLFYSGDLRAHGRKPKTFERLLLSPPKGIDALLLEGTRLSRTGEHDDPDENDVEEAMIALMSETEGLVLAMYSPQNVDRYVSVYRAALQADRDFVIDLYAASVAEATGRLGSIPQASWGRVRVFVPQAQRVRVKDTSAFSRVNRLRAHRIYQPELFSRPEDFVLTFRPSMGRELEQHGLKGSAAIWSMWPGYLQAPRMDGFHDFLEHNEIPLTLVHASGHARVEDLQRFAEALNPGQVVPIHTYAPQLFESLFARVECQANGEWWQV